MRVVRLVDEGSFAVELHPYVTVLAELGPSQRDAVAGAIAAMARGATDRLTGLLEVHGVMLDLDDSSLELLGLHSSSIDPRVTAADLARPTSATAGDNLAGPEARARSDHLSSLDRQIALLGSDVSPSPTEVDAAARRLEDARARVLALEREHSSGEIEAKERRELERLHAELDAARDATEGPFGKRAEPRRAAAEEAERELLDRLGLQSYTDYLIRGGSLPSLEPHPAELQEARENEVAAREELRVLESRVEDALHKAELVDERRRLSLDSAESVGEPDRGDLEWLLLARLAAQRDCSFVGSMPLLVDGALDDIDDDTLLKLLDQLERMSGAVQIIHLTDDPRIAAWASARGDSSAAVVRPVVPPSG